MTESDFKSLTDKELLTTAIWFQQDAESSYRSASKFRSRIGISYPNNSHMKYMTIRTQEVAAHSAEQSRLAVAEINRRKQNGIAS